MMKRRIGEGEKGRLRDLGTKRLRENSVFP
jgi:hypothetical protein